MLLTPILNWHQNVFFFFQFYSYIIDLQHCKSVLFIYNWPTALQKFKVHRIMFDLCPSWNDYHSKFNEHVSSQGYKVEKNIYSFLVIRMFRINFFSLLTVKKNYSFSSLKKLHVLIGHLMPYIQLYCYLNSSFYLLYICFS